MNKPLHRLLVLCLVSAAGVNLSHAQPNPVVDAGNYRQTLVAYSQADLDGMLAPIALYPDSLLAQILMAATYPLEITDAARWSRAILGVPAQEAVRSAANRGWDPSVQSLLAFPQVLDLLDRYPDWTQRLGNAFLAQQEQIWGTVQALRQRAYAAGQLRSSDQVRVLRNGNLIVLESAQPEVVYVPYYDPIVVYGNWWWPGYAPMRWNPWPGYVVRRSYDHDHRRHPVYVGSGIQVGVGFFFGQINWNTHRVTVHRPEPGHERPDWRRPVGPEWRHEPEHRRAVPYVNPQATARPPLSTHAVPPPSVHRGPQSAPEVQPVTRARQPIPSAQLEPVRPAAPKPDAPKAVPHSGVLAPQRHNAPGQGAAAAPDLPAPTKVERREPVARERVGGHKATGGTEPRKAPREQEREQP